MNTWQKMAAQEYGFYANVNPQVDHPRWSQARERRLPDFLANDGREMFNGYGDRCEPVHGHGSAQELLKPITILKAAALRRGAHPRRGARVRLLRSRRDLNDLTPIPATTSPTRPARGRSAARHLAHRDAAAAAHRVERADQAAADARPVRLLLRHAAHADVGGLRPLLRRRRFMVEDVVKRPFITVGMATFLILLALAVTSNRFSIGARSQVADAASPRLRRGDRRRDALLVAGEGRHDRAAPMGFRLCPAVRVSLVVGIQAAAGDEAGRSKGKVKGKAGERS